MTDMKVSFSYYLTTPIQTLMNALEATTVMYTVLVLTQWGPTPVPVSAVLQAMGSHAQVSLKIL